jgi:LmbE family N-acetylglucosaminyl deacetylase
LGLRLLCVVAHPDDECFAFGGALALAAKRGVETSVICLTDGQAATNRGASADAADLGRMRREEFVASCEILGVTHHELLDYQDAKLEFASISEIAGKLVPRMRSFKPHVVLTFGGDGAVNTHPDHMMVSFATTAAFHWSGNPRRYAHAGEIYQPQRLYTQTTNFFLPDRHKPLPSPWSATLDISSVFELKKQALAAHTSQAPLMHMALPLFEQHGPWEHYTLVAAAEPQPGAQSEDLFDGVTAD